MSDLPTKTTIQFKMRPSLLSRQLGADLYTSPSGALCRLVANSLDADSSRVDIRVSLNDLDTPETVVIEDDGHGMTLAELRGAFTSVGEHISRTSARDTIGSRGIGRFAVYALAPESTWTTVALDGGNYVRHEWVMRADGMHCDISSIRVDGQSTGTVIKLVLGQEQPIAKVFGSAQQLKRTVFNAFATYLLRYQDAVGIYVDGERVDPAEFIEQTSVEIIPESDTIPGAELRHIVLGRFVDQEQPTVLQFGSHGATISSKVVVGEPIPGRKYLGLVDSPYLAELTNTAKSDLAHLDARFLSLENECVRRAQYYVLAERARLGRSFIEEARSKPYYPFKNPPTTVVEAVRQQLYDGMLVTLETGYGIRNLPARQQSLIFQLARHLLQSEDLADVLTSVLDLGGEEMTKFADLLKRTSLSSMIAVSELLVGRSEFLEELRHLVYGPTASVVRERQHLHKIIEAHAWLFGEQYHLMGSDVSLRTLFNTIAKEMTDSDDPDSVVNVDADLRDVPDLYFMGTKWNEGPRYHQHLIVELKRPSVRITGRHIDQLKRYARQIVSNPMFGQRNESHRFAFYLVSANISDAVVTTEYQVDEEPGLLSRPGGLGHPTELWALRWSDLIDRQTEELRFLRDQIEVDADPADLAYLRRHVNGLLPDSLKTDAGDC